MKSVRSILTLLALVGFDFHAEGFYDPTQQRWINRDPLGEEGGSNLYGFVNNNPLYYLDPDGLDGTNPPPKPKPRPRPRPDPVPPNPPPPQPPKLPDAETCWPSAANAIDCIPKSTGPKKGTVPGAGQVGKGFLLANAAIECRKCCDQKYGLTSNEEDPVALKKCLDDCGARLKEIKERKQ